MVKKYAAAEFINEDYETVVIVPSDKRVCSSSWFRIFNFSNFFIRASEKTELARSFSSVGNDSSDDASRNNNRVFNFQNLYRDSSDEENCLPAAKKRNLKTLKESRSIKTKCTFSESLKARLKIKFKDEVAGLLKHLQGHLTGMVRGGQD